MSTPHAPLNTLLSLTSNPQLPESSLLSNYLSIDEQRHLPQQLRQNIKDSTHYNISLIFFYLVKTAVSGLVLCLTNPSCDPGFRRWVCYMIFHDLLYAFTLALQVKAIILKAFPRSDAATIENNNAGQQGTAEEDDPLRRDILGVQLVGNDSMFRLLDQAEKTNRLISALNSVCKVYYYAMFFYGQILYLHTETNCPEEPHTLVNLVVAYILLGYMYIGIPIIFVMLTCLLLPFFLLFSQVFLASPDNELAPIDQVRLGLVSGDIEIEKKVLKNLPIISYKADLPGDPECSICMNEYKEDEKLIQLRCSPMHHFHDECLKKWLKINGLCPICRMRIDENQDHQGQGRNIEMMMVNSDVENLV